MKHFENLVEICEDMRECLETIRYQEWPTIGLGIGLQEERLDELINEANRMITQAKRAITMAKKD